MVEEQIKKENEKENKISLKEERIRKISVLYYSRSDIRKNILEFSKNRECVPRYFEGFGKRPDAFQYDSDVIQFAKKGATSFHCSQELWRDPLSISTDMTQEDFNNLRIGWDLLIDVDSPYLDYSKIYAEILIEVLKSHGIKNIGAKFSGSKGFHIIIPCKAFPEQISGKKTAEMFPEWPRLICSYLSSQIHKKLAERVIDIQNPNKKLESLETYCVKCGTTVTKKSIFVFKCQSCKSEIKLAGEIFAKKRKISCPNCFQTIGEKKSFDKDKLEKEEFYFCNNCGINSKTNKNNFKEKVKSSQIDADLILVSPRHLFRMPYSLHEKTSMASIVINPEKIKDFDIRDADPLKVTPRNFLPDSEAGEATQLLLQALDYKQPESQIQKIEQEKTNFGKKKFKDITITNLTSDLYPPSIKAILKGMPGDGKKRALFILLSFFKSLKLSDSEIEKIIEEWNKKNKEPLKSGYIKAQISWYSKSKPKLPPNFDKSYYADIGISPTSEEIRAKNPVSYVIKKSFSRDYFKSRGRNNDRR
jgi:DNA primase catalytic subunit